MASDAVDHLPEVFSILLDRPRWATPLWVRRTSATVLEFHVDGIVVSIACTSGDPEWLEAAHKLGGLRIRIAPHTRPDMITVLAEWEGTMYSLSGVPSRLDAPT